MRFAGIGLGARVRLLKWIKTKPSVDAREPVPTTPSPFMRPREWLRESPCSHPTAVGRARAGLASSPTVCVSMMCARIAHPAPSRASLLRYHGYWRRLHDRGRNQRGATCNGTIAHSGVGKRVRRARAGVTVVAARAWPPTRSCHHEASLASCLCRINLTVAMSQPGPVLGNATFEDGGEGVAQRLTVERLTPARETLIRSMGSSCGYDFSRGI